LILYDLIKMGDPIRIVDNLTSSSISSITFDNEDNIITVATQDYKILFYNLQSVLNDDLSLKIDMEENENNTKNRLIDYNIQLMNQYITKKTTILVLKYTQTNILLTLGRFDDNDPKIFM
jgi:hypothetical protein